jgi:hypothetical protein
MDSRSVDISIIAKVAVKHDLSMEFVRFIYVFQFYRLAVHIKTLDRRRFIMKYLGTFVFNERKYKKILGIKADLILNQQQNNEIL